MESNNGFKFRTPSSLIGTLFDDNEHKILSPLSWLREFDSHWILEFDLPLVNKKNIKVTFDKNIISIEAKLKEKYSEEKLGKITKFEYFKKSIQLPEKIDSKKTTVKFQKGRLIIKIPKKVRRYTIKIK